MPVTLPYEQTFPWHSSGPAIHGGGDPSLVGELGRKVWYGAGHAEGEVI